MAAPLLSACSSSDSDDNEPKGTVKIGLVVPQNGANKAVGDEMRNGFELFRNLNASRFGGYNVELIAADEGESADSAKAAVEKLVKEDKVLAVSGISTSLALQAVRETVETAHIPLVASNSCPRTCSTPCTSGARRTSTMNRAPPWASSSPPGSRAAARPS
jgi:branched-chain amino acid transport system substrate-binding protein